MCWSGQECSGLVLLVNNGNNTFEYAWCLDNVDFNDFDVFSEMKCFHENKKEIFVD